MSAKANHLEQTCLQCRHLMVAVCRNVQNVPAEKYIFILQLCAFYACKKQGGGMAWMSTNMKMETSTRGGVGKLMGRALSGDTLFQNTYTAQGGRGLIAVSSSFPGEVRAFEITPENPMIFQKSAFLCSDAGVELSMFFRKKVAAGLFGGEGFIMQKVSGNGIVFAEFDGSVVEYNLKEGQQIIVDTGNLAAMSATCNMEVQTVPGVKNMLFGGEGLFNTVVTGPGHVWLQTMPISSVAAVLRPFFPTTGA